MAGAAAGNNTWRSAAALVNPSAAAPCRQSCDTDDNPDSVARIRMGNTMQASVSPPDTIEKPRPRNRQKNALPNRPNTIEGMPARTSSARLMVRAARLERRENSLSQTATPTPSGTATARVTASIKSVETRMVEMPPLRPELLGASVRNAHDNFANPCATISSTIHKKKPATSAAAIQTAAEKTRSRKRDELPKGNAASAPYRALISSCMSVDRALRNTIRNYRKCRNHKRQYQPRNK